MTSLTAVTIGNFDGVHLGHAGLVRAARNHVGDAGAVVALTFDPHPLHTLRSRGAPGRLSTFAQRTRWLKDAGADRVERLKPDHALLDLTPEAFLRDVIGQYGPTVVVEGPDFRFGRGRSGSITTLAELGRELSFQCVVIDPVEATLDDQSIVTISSSLIRWLLARGRVKDAAELLGRPYELETEVVRGNRRGRAIGWPTINLQIDDRVLPADGVYAGVAKLPGGEARLAAISVGTNPTFADPRPTCEAHLLDFDGPADDYDWTVRLELHHWLRDQITFSDIAPLVDQIGRDVRRTREILEGMCIPV